MEPKRRIKVTTSVVISLFALVVLILSLRSFPATSPYYLGEDSDAELVLFAYFLLMFGVIALIVDIGFVADYLLGKRKKSIIEF